METPSIEKLYEEYGRLMVQMELIQSRTNEVKKLIAEDLNKKAAAPPPASAVG